jgi:hypothetical protein
MLKNNPDFILRIFILFSLHKLFSFSHIVYIRSIFLSHLMSRYSNLHFFLVRLHKSHKYLHLTKEVNTISVKERLYNPLPASP